jgi:hypothetical protein
MRALHCFTFLVVGVIAVMIAVDVPTLLLVIIVRAALGIVWSNLALHPVSTTLVLACKNLIAKLVFELEVSVFLDTLEFHAFEHTNILVRGELGFEELGDRLKGLGLKFLAHCNKLVAVILAKQHIEPLKR